MYLLWTVLWADDDDDDVFIVDLNKYFMIYATNTICHYSL